MLVEARCDVVLLGAMTLVALPATAGAADVDPKPRIVGVLAAHDGDLRRAA